MRFVASKQLSLFVDREAARQPVRLHAKPLASRRLRYVVEVVGSAMMILSFLVMAFFA